MIRRVFYLVILYAFLLAGCGKEVGTLNEPTVLPQSPVQQDAYTRAVPSGVGSYSGDDPYDPAVESSDIINPVDAAGSGESLPVTGGQTSPRMAENYSGDDPYDPAAGGLNR